MTRRDAANDGGPSDRILEAALGGDLPPEQLERLLADPNDRARYEEALRVLRAVDALPRPEPRPGLRRGLMARIDQEDDRRARGFFFLGRTAWWGRPFTLGAGFAVAAAGILLLVTRPLEVPDSALARIERLELAADRELYENLEVLEHLDVLDDLELIASLPEESG